MEARYQIIEGKTKEVIREVRGEWRDVRRKLQRGEYAKRVIQNQGDQDAYRMAAMVSKQARRRKAFIALPQELRKQELEHDAKLMGATINWS